MEIETLNYSYAPPDASRSVIYSASYNFDLPTLIYNLKHSHLWETGELNSMILLKSQGKQILLTALHNKTEVNSFQVNESIAIQIIEGELRFHTEEESVTLKKGQLLTLHEKIGYSLTTIEETVILLTISNGSLKASEN